MGRRWRCGEEGATNMSEEHRSPLGAAIDSLASSYKQLLDATLALNVAEIPYAICGGFAVAAWCLYHEQQLLKGADPTRVVAPKPITLVNTRDVDMLVWKKVSFRQVCKT